MITSIAGNIQRVQDNIADACARVNRDPSSVTLVAVSKRKPAEDVLAALAAGVQHFGENRVEEAEQKLPAVAAQLGDLPAPVWHMVGHVQSRKAAEVAAMFSQVHSVDSVRLARRLNRFAVERRGRLSVFVQVNVAGEKQKYGFDGANWQTDSAVRDTLFRAFQQITAFDALDVRGLMTMAPYGASERVLRGVFTSLAALKLTLEGELKVTLPDLSMGMTDDYPLAIEAGATVVRVGRAIFGERDT